MPADFDRGSGRGRNGSKGTPASRAPSANIPRPTTRKHAIGFTREIAADAATKRKRVEAQRDSGPQGADNAVEAVTSCRRRRTRPTDENGEEKKAHVEPGERGGTFVEEGARVGRSESLGPSEGGPPRARATAAFGPLRRVGVWQERKRAGGRRRPAGERPPGITRDGERRMARREREARRSGARHKLTGLRQVTFPGCEAGRPIRTNEPWRRAPTSSQERRARKRARRNRRRAALAKQRRGGRARTQVCAAPREGSVHNQRQAHLRRADKKAAHASRLQVQGRRAQGRARRPAAGRVTRHGRRWRAARGHRFDRTPRKPSATVIVEKRQPSTRGDGESPRERVDRHFRADQSPRGDGRAAAIRGQETVIALGTSNQDNRAQRARDGDRPQSPGAARRERGTAARSP